MPYMLDEPGLCFLANMSANTGLAEGRNLPSVQPDAPWLVASLVRRSGERTIGLLKAQEEKGIVWVSFALDGYITGETAPQVECHVW